MVSVTRLVLARMLVLKFNCCPDTKNLSAGAGGACATESKQKKSSVQTNPGADNQNKQPVIEKTEAADDAKANSESEDSSSSSDEGEEESPESYRVHRYLMYKALPRATKTLMRSRFVYQAKL